MECVGAADLVSDMRKKEILIGDVFLATGTGGVALLLIGGGASKWGPVILAVGMIAGGLLQWLCFEQRKQTICTPTNRMNRPLR